MRLQTIVPVFATLLAVSTATSFLGYRYLSLASEYRERNFLHLRETQSVLDLIRERPILRTKDRVQAREHIQLAGQQAAWCIDNLSGAEVALFRQLGASNALGICAKDLQIVDKALATLDAFATAVDAGSDPSGTRFALGLQLRAEVQEMRNDSLAFQPYVTVIEEKIRRIVMGGTGIAALCLAAIFFLVAREMARGVQERAKQTRALQELAAVAERANDSIVVTDLAGTVIWVNPSFEELTGYTLVEIKGKKPGSLLQGPDTDPQAVNAIRDAIRHRKPIKQELINYTRQGEPYWIVLSISPLENDLGEHYGFVAISDDITWERTQRDELARAHEEISHQALHDPLTTLPNRRALDLAIKERELSGRQATIVRIDLDHFK